MKSIFYIPNKCCIIFNRPDGRLVKLFLFPTLLHKSPLTSVYFATFEKKREVRSPLPHNQTFWLLVNFTFFDYMSTYVLELSYILDRRISKITTRQT